MKTYLVNSKPDDYGACIKELVQTELHLAKQYYNHTVVLEQDVSTLKKYLHFVGPSEEIERSEDQRFYGAD